MNSVESFTSVFTSEVPVYVRCGSEVYFGSECPSYPAPLLYTSSRLGFFVGSSFKPAIALLNWLSSRTERVAVVNEHSAWLFTCRKNILKEGIVSNPCSEGSVLVVNEFGDVLGWGVISGAGITNKFDIGDFLRRE